MKQRNTAKEQGPTGDFYLREEFKNLNDVDLSRVLRAHSATIDKLRDFARIRKGPQKAITRVRGALLEEQARQHQEQRTAWVKDGHLLPFEPATTLDLSSLQQDEGSAETLNAVEVYLDFLDSLTDQASQVMEADDSVIDKKQALADLKGRLGKTEKFLESAGEYFKKQK